MCSGLYYYGARFYDPSVVRFLSVDRFAEQFPAQSPYTYVSNNPIRYIDINGDSIKVYHESGEYMFTVNDNLPNEDHFYTVGKFRNLNYLKETFRTHSTWNK